jgi:23S rRNA (pseudouridine1915-N3)-methyltransferase
MSIKIIAVGKKHESWVVDGIERYQKRLKKPFVAEWVLLPHSTFEADRARQEESERILSRLDGQDFVILLDERGDNISSPQLSSLLQTTFEAARPVIIVIGGAYGVDDAMHNRADFTWSLSKLVFPHQLVRLLLTEQLYRAQEIALDNPYHHS